MFFETKMQRPVQNRTMIAIKDNTFNARSTPVQSNQQLSSINYCPVSIGENSHKEEIDKLIAQYDELHHQIHQIKHRLHQLGFIKH